MKKATKITLGAVGVLAAFAVIATVTNSDKSDGYVYGAEGSGSRGDYSAVQEVPTETPTPAPAKPTGIPQGMFLIGKDYPAGSYRTAGPADGALPSCYWERLSDATGEFDAIIANGNPVGPTTVTVSAGEYFNTMGCQEWVPA